MGPVPVLSMRLGQKQALPVFAVVLFSPAAHAPVFLVGFERFLSGNCSSPVRVLSLSTPDLRFRSAGLDSVLILVERADAVPGCRRFRNECNAHRIREG